MAVHLDGPDPYFSGPPRDYPPGVPLTHEDPRCGPRPGACSRSSTSGRARGPSRGSSVRVGVKKGAWQERTVFLPPLGPGFRLRLDPPGTRGVCLIESIRFEPRLVIAEPDVADADVPALPPTRPVVAAGPLALRQHPAEFGGFTVRRQRPAGRDRSQPAADRLPRGRGAPSAGSTSAKLAKVPRTSRFAEAVDGRGRRSQTPTAATGGCRQTFRPPGPGGDRRRPPRPGRRAREPWSSCRFRGAAGARLVRHAQGQGLFAGVEYLENEPSSSTADLDEQAGAEREVPDSARITFPLMAIQAHGDYVGLIWEPVARGRGPVRLARPDARRRRAPAGADRPGGERDEPGERRAVARSSRWNSTRASRSRPGRRSSAARARACSPRCGSTSRLEVPPARPKIARPPGLYQPGRGGLARLADPRGPRFRHAVGGELPGPAGGRRRLDDGAARRALRPIRPWPSGSGRRPPAPRPRCRSRRCSTPRWATCATPSRRWCWASDSSPASQAVVVGLDQARAMARGLARAVRARRVDPLPAAPGRHRLRPDALLRRGERADRRAGRPPARGGRVRGRPGDGRGGAAAVANPQTAVPGRRPPRGPDLGDPAAHARHPGLGLPGQGLRPGLRADRRSRPARGRAVLGLDRRAVRLPGESRAGPGAVGPFATIPVLGATNWVAPNWIGLPVQWCGLVYAEAALRPGAARPGRPVEGRWPRGSRPRASSQTYPLDHPHRGLLPDSFNLAEQSRNPADINPGTLQPPALRLLAGERGVAYTFRALRNSGLWIHVPGTVHVDEDGEKRASFTIWPWSPRHSYAVIHGVRPGVRVDSSDGRCSFGTGAFAKLLHSG